MVLLNCVYSETGLFEKISFHKGINIILGKYHPEHGDPDGKRSVNGIGKSTLVRLIDFALLAAPHRSPLNPRKLIFLKDHNVVLEFTVNDETFKITRSFEKPNEILFGFDDHSLGEYTVPELREILSRKFFDQGSLQGGYYSSTWFRSLVKFFIKDDIKRYRQDSPINFLNYHERRAKLMTFNFYLLGLPNHHIHEYGMAKEKADAKRATKRELEGQIETETGKSIGEFRTEAARVQETISMLESNLRDYEFIESYQDVEEKLNKVTRQISKLLQEYHTYSKTLERYQDSYRIEIEVDHLAITKLYEEVNHELAGFVRKTLEQVIQFRRDIADNRRQFLTDKERELNEAVRDTLAQISKLETKRKRLYNLLQERGALDSIKHTYEQLLEEKVGFEQTNAKLVQIFEIEASLGQFKAELFRLASEIIRNIRDSQDKINEIRLLYKEILENAIFVDESTVGGFLDVHESERKQPPIEILVDVPKSASLGKHRFSMLAYSLTVFLNIIRSQRALPHFLIHDGVFHSIAKRTVVNVLNYVYHESLIHHDFQYIITGNEDELYIHPSDEHLYGKFDFNFEQSLVAVYETDPEKMIFKMDF